MHIEIANSISRYFTITAAIEGMLGEAISDLRKSGYTLSLRREATWLYCVELDQRIVPNDFSVDRFIHFRAQANPDADRIVYAISLSQGAKGYLIDTCFVYSDNISPEMTEKLMIDNELSNPYHNNH